MDSLPSVELGAILLAALAVTWLARVFIQPRLFRREELTIRPARQLALELALYPAAGLLAYLALAYSYGFPLGSGLNLLSGFLVLAVFLGLDMALARERLGIHLAVERGAAEPPRRLFPMTRAFLLFALGLAVLTALVLSLILLRDVSMLQSGELAGSLGRELTLEIFFVMAGVFALSANLIWSFSRNLHMLFSLQTETMERIREGDLSVQAPVATANEFGLIAARTNDMLHGLRHRVKLLSALNVAREVQDELLPREDPGLEGVQAAGDSQSCDEIGGDCYDFITTDRNTLLAAVADVSGHGVGPALLMASTRALLRSAAARYEHVADVAGEVNRLLFPDVADSGRFVTLFLAEIDPAAREIRFVRAGHDPALLLEPGGQPRELTTRGAALGVLDSADYAASSLRYQPGALLVVATDGIWEARSPDGEMYGKQRFAAKAAALGDRPPRELVEALLEDWRAFLEGEPAEDDATLIAIKLF
jgi:sigma-B regulation protein RsbU (phosphoserine phosphatase)